jgi:hypothetical protein
MPERTTYQSDRWTVVSDLSPAELKARYEAAVPPVPERAVAELVARGAAWREMTELIGAAAPFGFLRYHQVEGGAVMPLAGHLDSCTTYLMGNHVIAERMYRYEPAVMLYAPLRVTLWARPEQAARLTFDRPSGQFASFGNDDIAAVGRELDRKLAALLEHLDLEVPAGLGTERGPR